MSKTPSVQWEDEDSAFDFESALSEQKSQNEFAELFDDSDSVEDEFIFEPGQTVKGTISGIGEMDILIDFGTKEVGILPKDEVTDAAGKISVAIGDPIEGIIIEIRDAEIILSKKMKASLRSREGLEMAYQNKIPIKGRVIGKNKGGFDIAITGSKAFCPISQMDTKFVEDQTGYMNKEFDFLIEKMNGKDVVVSRAAAMRLQGEAQRKIILAQWEQDKDAIFQGVVTSTKDFGAFVDVSGLEGMVHISELSLSRVSNVSEVVTIGDNVQVKILQIKADGNRERISMSMKACSQNPWTIVDEKITEGATCTGKVARLVDYGAFIELIPGIDGFVHISEMSWVKRVRHPSDILKEGQSVDCRILSIDKENQKVSLTLKSIEADPWNEAQAKLNEGNTIFAKVESLKSFGAIMEVLPGVTGLLPISTIKRAFGDLYRKNMQMGLEVEVKVVNRDDAQRKVLLALPNVEEDNDDQEAFVEYLAIKKKKEEEEQKLKVSDKGLGSFGELLAAKLKNK